MKKQIIIVGIIVLLVTVGLSGCTSEESVLTVSSVLADKQKYDNKTINVDGYIDIRIASIYYIYHLYDSDGINYIVLDYVEPANASDADKLQLYSGLNDGDHIIVTGVFYKGKSDSLMDVISLKKID
jgi:hypothetical protein